MSDDDGARGAGPRLWKGDVGTVSEPSRRVLLELLKGPYLSGRRRPQLWSALLADEAAVRAQLHNLFLDLVIDTVDEFAFVRKVRTSELDVPSPLRTETLAFLDTAMLLVLRQTLLAAPGESRVIVGQAEIFERLDIYRTGDLSSFTRNLNAAWGRMTNRFRVLHAVGDDRAEISPVIKFVLDHDMVLALTEEYARLAGDAGAAEKNGEPGETGEPGEPGEEDA